MIDIFNFWADAFLCFGSFVGFDFLAALLIVISSYGFLSSLLSLRR